MSSSGSDSGDEDYVPSEASQPPSEVESDGDEEDLNLCDKEEGDGKAAKGKKKGNKREQSSEAQEEESPVKEESGDIKKKSDSLWSDFMKQVSPSEKEGSCSSKIPESKIEKQVVTQVYEFAGEKVTVQKEVEVETEVKKRKVSILPEESEVEEAEVAKVQEKPVSARKSVLGLSCSSHAIAKPKLGGSILSSALDKLGKKNKLSTLEKSKLDWENYKSKEGIKEELTSHNKGKLGYLDKRDFLDRTDLKQYELEKQLRNTQRSKR